jgi:hypothetical protein
MPVSKNLKNWENVIINGLEFIKRSDTKTSSGTWLWEVKCICGKIFKTLPNNIVTKVTKSCGCLKRNGFNLKRKNHPKIGSARAIWNSMYKSDGLSFDDFYNLSQKNCYYCNSKPATKYNAIQKTSSEYQIKEGLFVYNGLDRIDSNLGHIKENVVPCCVRCNRSKMDYTQEEFLNMIKNIFEKHIKKDN